MYKRVESSSSESRRQNLQKIHWSYLCSSRGFYPGRGGEAVHHRRAGDCLWSVRQCGVWIYLLAVDTVCLKAAASQAAKAPALVKGKSKAGAEMESVFYRKEST